MKLFMIMLLTALIGCGKGGSGSSSTLAPSPGNPVNHVTPITHIYTMQVTGDVGMTGQPDYYAVSMSVNFNDSDVQTIATGTVGPLTNGAVATYNLTGRYLRQVQINKNNDTAPEAGLSVKLYRDGILVQTAPTLNVGGTWAIFDNQD